MNALTWIERQVKNNRSTFISKHRIKSWFCVMLFAFCVNTANAQTDSATWFHNFITPSDTFNKTRLSLTLGTEAAVYTGFGYLLYNYWYRDYNLVQFHTFNDMGEWKQMDKIGHAYTAFLETNISTGWYHWTGMKDENTYWAGAVTGSLLQLMIETMDGFSEKWGFSVGDFAANTLGAGFSMTQNYLWDEQRIRIKFSSHFVDHSGDGEDAMTRADALFGESSAEKVLKDYNGQTYWLSINPSQFMRGDTKFPKWLMVSAGYGANGLYGGFENTWCPDPEISPEFCPDDMLIDRTDIDRYRQYYFSFDIDLTQLPADSPFWKMMFEILNIVKVPAPAIEFSERHGVKFYPLYF